MQEHLRRGQINGTTFVLDYSEEYMFSTKSALIFFSFPKGFQMPQSSNTE